MTVHNFKNLVPNIYHRKCTKWGSFSASKKNILWMSILDMAQENNGKRRRSTYENNKQEKNFQGVNSRIKNPIRFHNGSAPVTALYFPFFLFQMQESSYLILVLLLSVWGALQIKRSNIQTWYRNFHISPRVFAPWVWCYNWVKFEDVWPWRWGECILCVKKSDPNIDNQ